ncbi:hypothetical protein [Streptomyces sp. NPDC058280]|uniref:hypothetical protein n=1 Tax=Streptomyces sp. NPDC058280 TaxID=3346419 RepID=UPI0036EDC7BE
MPPEGALLESRSMRDSVMGRIDALDKVKALRLLPDGVHITTEGAARYFEIHREAVHSLVKRHRDELHANGMITLKGSDLQDFEMANLATSADGAPVSYPQGRAHLRLFTRRAVLNIAMLMRDSDIARCVRTYLLDAEDDLRKGYANLDRRVTDVETCLGGVGVALQELGPVLHRMSYRLDSLDRRLDATNQVVAAISNRLCQMSEDINRVDARVDDVVHQLRDLRRGRKRR